MKHCCGRWKSRFCSIRSTTSEGFLRRQCCVEALCAIRRALDADTQDAECFRRIEEIVKIYEAIGADGGARHDF